MIITSLSPCFGGWVVVLEKYLSIVEAPVLLQLFNNVLHLNTGYFCLNLIHLTDRLMSAVTVIWADVKWSKVVS